MKPDVGERLGRIQAPDLWQEIEHRVEDAKPVRSHRALRVAVSSVVLVVAIGAVGWALFALRDLHAGHTRSAEPGFGQVTRYRLPGEPQTIDFGYGTVWTAVGASAHDQLWKVDATSGESSELSGTLNASWPTVGEAAVWAIGDQSASRASVLELDPSTGHVDRTISLSVPPDQITTGLGSVWATTSRGIAKIDPSTGRITSVLDVPNGDLVGIGGGAIWVTRGASLKRLDPETGRQLASVPFSDPCTMETSPQIVWVASCGGGKHINTQSDELMALDATTGGVLYRVRLPQYGGQLLLADGTLWVAQQSQERASIRVLALDPETGKESRPPLALDAGPDRSDGELSYPPAVFLTAGDGALWLTDFQAKELIRVELPPSKPAPTGSSAEVSSELAARAAEMARSNGNEVPPTAEAVLTTYQAAVSVTSRDGNGKASDQPVYLVQMVGNFQAQNAKVPYGADVPTGRALYFTFDPSSRQIADWGLMKEPADLSKLGTVVTFDLPSAAPDAASPSASGVVGSISVRGGLAPFATRRHLGGTVTVLDSAGSIVTTVQVPAGGDYRIALQPGDYRLEAQVPHISSGVCGGLARVTSGEWITAPIVCQLH